ncbi:MAG: hypothetical protein ACP5VN_03585 [Acidobacteriota bacterium]
MNPWSRRQFLERMGAAGFGALTASALRAWNLGAPENPLALYPERGWEKAYRDLWRVDSTFTFLCAPNDTHNCLLKAHVRNGVVTRIGPSMRYGEAEDLYGNRTSHRWDPRVCQKGLALTRRFYGDRRISGCRVREGFMKWVEAGFPRAKDGLPPRQYFNRGRDGWLKVSHEKAAEVVAAALENIATAYSGEEGRRRLLTQGYDEATVETLGGAGVRTLKFRGGMPLLGMTRVLGFYRMANSMALLDAHIRRVSPDEASGASGGAGAGTLPPWRGRLPVGVGRSHHRQPAWRRTFFRRLCRPNAGRGRGGPSRPPDG